MLKNDRYKDREKKVQTEELLGPLSEEKFSLFVNLSRKITDFGNEGKTQVAGEHLFIFKRLICRFVGKFVLFLCRGNYCR